MGSPKGYSGIGGVGFRAIATSPQRGDVPPLRVAGNELGDDTVPAEYWPMDSRYDTVVRVKPAPCVREHEPMMAQLQLVNPRRKAPL
jgi:hypothetical protein